MKCLGLIDLSHSKYGILCNHTEITFYMFIDKEYGVTMYVCEDPATFLCNYEVE